MKIFTQFSGRPSLALAIGISFLLFLTACDSEVEARRSDEKQSLQLAEFYRSQGSIKASIIEIRNALKANAESAEAHVLLGQIQLDLEDGAGAESSFLTAQELGFNEVELGVLYVKSLILQKKFREALDRIDVISNASEMDRSWRAMKGEALLGLGDLDAAEAEFRGVPGESGNFASALLGLAKVSLSRGHADEVDAYLAKALEADGSLVDAWIWKGRLALLREDLPAAERAYYKVRELESNDVLTRRKIEALHGVMKAKIGQNRLDEAFQYHKDFLAFYPDSVLAEYERGLALFNDGDLIGAEKVFETVVDRSPGHDQSTLLLGLISYAKGDHGRVAALLSKQVEQGDANPLVKRLFAMAQLRMGNASEALKVLRGEVARQPDDAELMSLFGMALMSTGALADAETALVKAVELAPDKMPILLNLARLYVQAEKPNKALDVLAAAGRDGSESVKAEMLRVAALLLLGEQEEANSVAAALVQKNNNQRDNYAASLAGIVGTALSIGQVKWAENFMREVEDDDPKSDIPKTTSAHLYLSNQDFTAAVTAAQRALAINSAEPRSWEVLGRAQIALQNPSAAAEAFSKLVELRPEDVRAQLQAGAAYSRVGDIKKGREYVNMALERDPEDSSALELAALLEIKAGNAAVAQSHIAALKRFNPDSSRAHEIEGDMFFNENQYPSALLSYRRAFEMKPASGVVIKVFSTLFRLDSKGDAFRELEAWMESNPSDAVARSVAANTYLMEGRSNDAIRHFLVLLETEPDSPEILNNLAWLYHEIGDSSDLGYAERAYAGRPDSGAICDTLGWILVERGEYERGVELLNRAAQLSPDLAGVREHLAIARQRAGLE